MRLSAAFISVLALAACQTPCPSQAPAARTAQFQCDDGSHLTVTFTSGPDRAHIEQEGYAPVDLHSSLSGSGYRYTDRGADLRGRGGDVRWQRPGASETQCHEQVTPP